MCDLVPKWIKTRLPHTGTDMVLCAHMEDILTNIYHCEDMCPTGIVKEQTSLPTKTVYETVNIFTVIKQV